MVIPKQKPVQLPYGSLGNIMHSPISKKVAFQKHKDSRYLKMRLQLLEFAGPSEKLKAG